MTGLPPADISIHSDGERLILPTELDEHEIAAIKEHKPEILKALRSSQMNPAVFYTQLPVWLRRGLQAAPWVALSIETTALYQLQCTRSSLCRHAHRFQYVAGLSCDHPWGFTEHPTSYTRAIDAYR
jgi:hypothetical protein